MKKFPYCTFIFICCIHFLYSQDKSAEKLYINFDEDSEIYYWAKTEMGEQVKRKTYVKNNFDNGNIDFYIENLLFAHRPAKMIKKELDTAEINCSNLLSAKEIKKHINKIQKIYPIGPKYPTKEFSSFFIAERRGEKLFLYEVWRQFYND